MALKETVRNGKVVKKIVRKKKVSSSDQPLTKRQELNNHIVCMRNTVTRVKVQIINRLIHQIQKYRKRKGNEEEKLKANRKADRLVEEIQALKKLKKDKVSLFALLDTQKLEDVLNNPKALLEEKALDRLTHHPLIQNDVKTYRDANPNWDMQISVLLEMTRQKKKPKNEDDETTASKSNDNEDATRLVKLDKGIKSDADDVVIKTKPQSDSESSSDSDDPDIKEEDTPVVEEKVQAKPKPTKQNKNTSKLGLNVKNKNSNQSKPNSCTNDKSAGAVKVKFLKDLAELEEESVETVSIKPLNVDITKAPVVKRPKSAFFVGGVDEPEEEAPKDFQKPTFTRNPNTPAKPVFRKGKLVSKPPPRQTNYNQNRQVPPGKFGRPDNRFSGNAEPVEVNSKRSRFSTNNPELQEQNQEPAEKLHPSWEAKKKQQQISLTAFKGKKITFDDDD